MSLPTRPVKNIMASVAFQLRKNLKLVFAMGPQHYAQITMSILRAKIRGLHWSHWLSLLGLAALFVVLRSNNYDAPLIRDEGEYAYAAQLLIQGVAPYQHAFIQKPPGVIYTYALADLFLPQHFWSVRLLAYVFVALAT